MSYSMVERGAPYSLTYRGFFVGQNGLISPIHDIPLYASEDSTSPIFNMVVEIPRWTNAKMEICKEEKLNPMRQDVRKGKVRYIDNCFPYHGYIWNYGALPQTYEDPTHIDEHTHLRGDNDPIDVCEIGFRVQKCGDVIQVKVLGVVALIDEGETDWKLIAIDVNDPHADDFNDIDDVENLMPGLLHATDDWFKIYKVPTGKAPNTFAFDGKAKDRAFALGRIRQANDQWQKVMQKKPGDGPLALINTTLTGSAACISQEEAKTIVDKTSALGTAAAIPKEVDKWHFIRL